MTGSRTSYLFLITQVVIFTSLPFITFIGVNKTENLQYSTLLLGWGICIFSFLVGLIVVKQKVKDPVRLRKIINSLCVAFIVLFWFGPLEPFIRHNLLIRSGWTVLLIWAVILGTCVSLAWVLSKNPITSKALILIASVMMFVSLFKIVQQTYISYSLEEKMTIGIDDKGIKVGSPLPNIYYFLFDGYGRADNLLTRFGYDSTPFQEEMEKLGFTFLEKSNSNYMFTFASMGTVFDMEYLVLPGNEMDFKKLEYKSIIIRQTENKVMRFMKSLGYTTFYTSKGSDYCLGGSDVCIKKEYGIGSTAWAFIGGTPVYKIIRVLLRPDNTDPRVFLPEILTMTLEKLEQFSGPKFVYCHILLPHRPFLKEDCSRLPLSGHPEDDYEVMKYYPITVNCLNQHILDNIPKILKEDPDAFIIIQGDHGYGAPHDFEPPVEEWSESVIRGRFGILNAIRAPKGCEKLLKPTLTSVNTFRFVKACLTGEEPDYLPDRSYIVTPEEHLGYGEIPKVILWKDHTTPGLSPMNKEH